MTDDELEAALRHSPDSVSIYELDSTVVYMNPRTEEMMGAAFADLRGKQLFSLYPDAEVTAFYKAFHAAVQGGGDQVFEHYYPRFDGWYANHVTRVGERVHVYAREITEEVRRRRRLEALSRISQVLTRELDVHSMAHALSSVMSDVLDAQCTIATLSPDRKWLELVARTSPDPDVLALTAPLVRWSAETGASAEALRTRTAVLEAGDEVTPDELADPTLREVMLRYEPGSVVVAPLVIDEQPSGVLIASRRRTAPLLTRHDRTLLGEVAPTVALYLSNASRRTEATQLRNRLTTMTDALPALAAFIDRDERYQYVNGAYERWFGRPREDYLGRTLHDMVGPEGYDVIDPYVRQVLAGRTVRYRSRVPYPTGTRDVDASYIPVYGADGTIDGFAVLVQDVSTEQRIVDIERRATRRLESLLRLTGRLAGAATREDIARELVDGTVDVLDSAMAAMWRLAPDGNALELLRERNMVTTHVAQARRLPLSPPGPLGDALATGRPIWMSSRREYAERYPELESAMREGSPIQAFAALPLVIEGNATHVLSFAFTAERVLTGDERMYLEVITSHAAEAMRRANAYAELYDVNELQAAVIQSSPGAIIMFDDNGCVRSWNTAASRIFGWNALQVIGKPLPGLADDAFRKNLAAVLAGQEMLRVESRRQRASGEWFDLEVYAAPVRLSSGDPMCVAVVFDISDRKRVERGRQLVTEASTRFNQSLDLDETLREVVQLPLGTLASWCCVDLIGDDGMLHRVALTKEQCAPGIAIPRTLVHSNEYGGISAAIATRSPQVLVDIDDATLQRLARNEPHLAAMRTLNMRSSISVPLVFGDRVVGALSVVASDRNYDDLDVTIVAELAAHAATAIENARLFALAKKARRDAEDANRSKDEFLAMLGHELRNPLAPLTTALELMRMRGGDQFAREQAVLRRQVDHLSRLVDDLLDVSRITRGKIELRREKASLVELVGKAIEQTSPLFDERRHHVSVDIANDLAVHGDPTRLAQIFANLLSNAAKYTPPGGRIDVTAQRDAETVVLTVRDNGVGISADMLPRVFDLFVQAPQARERPVGGLGLGLTIVRSLVELHGGHVFVRSDGLGKGSEFSVALPAAQSAVPASGEIPLLQRIRTSEPRRILVVDDNEDAALMLSDLLDIYGHEIRTAFDAPSALRIASEFKPDIAVLDIGLPVMDGYELAERLRAIASLSELRLIAVTGYGQESDRARSREAGFAAHLAKPIQIEDLVQLVEGN